MYFNAKETMHIMYNQKLLRLEAEKMQYEKIRDESDFEHIKKVYQQLINTVDGHIGALHEALMKRHVA